MQENEASQRHINKHRICSYILMSLKWWKEKAGEKDRIMESVLSATGQRDSKFRRPSGLTDRQCAISAFL